MQTQGRGRQGRIWGTGTGNLHASTLVRERRGDPPAATLALVAAVALHELLSAHVGGRDLIVKWPNDLLLEGAKVSGILLEKSGDAIVIGFGVNLAWHPQGLDRAVTSLPALGLPAPHPSGFVHDLAEAFARWVARWRGEGLGPVRARWLAIAHPIGTPLIARQDARADIEGLFDGLDENGALRLRLADGSRHVIHAGDVFAL